MIGFVYSEDNLSDLPSRELRALEVARVDEESLGAAESGDVGQ